MAVQVGDTAPVRHDSCIVLARYDTTRDAWIVEGLLAYSPSMCATVRVMICAMRERLRIGEQLVARRPDGSVIAQAEALPHAALPVRAWESL